MISFLALIENRDYENTGSISPVIFRVIRTNPAESNGAQSAT